MGETKNRHHIFPRSRTNGKDILGVCENKSLQKFYYNNLVIDQDDIIKVFDFFNETFWDKHFEILEIYYNKTGLKGKKKQLPCKIEIRSRKKRKKNPNRVRLVPKDKHEIYHFLFGNMMPWEAFEKLNNDFWKNLFTIKDLSEIKKDLIMI